MTFDQACEAIIRAARLAGPSALLHYAASYAKAGLGMTGEARKVQTLYILNNLGGWRGDEAKQVRMMMRMIGGVK